MAHLIISCEYYANTPSVFLLADGNYYGCKIYPSHHNNPKDFNYWITTEGSDVGRYFTINEVQVSDADFAKIQKLQNVVDANESMVNRTSYKNIKKEWQVKRGNAYEEWKKAVEDQKKEIMEEYKNNEPFERARASAFRMLHNMLLSLDKK